MIIFNSVSKSYRQTNILHDLNFTIPASSFTLFTGDSGAGKSTLLSLICGLEPPTSGEITINDQNFANLPTSARLDFYRHQFGIVFQSTYLLPQLSVAENISLPGIFASLPLNQRQTRTAELAQLFQISNILSQRPTEISGGQTERACIARALFLQPQIILADEPTNNLDTENASIVANYLQYIQQHFHITIVVASHDPIFAAYANQTIHLANHTATIL